jgi:hypothetical protein
MGLQNAQAVMGHANLAKTDIYLSQPTHEEIAAASSNGTLESERTFQGVPNPAAKPEEAPTGIEPVYTALQAAA